MTLLLGLSDSAPSTDGSSAGKYSNYNIPLFPYPITFKSKLYYLDY